MRTLTALNMSWLALLAMHPHDNVHTRRVIRRLDDPFVKRVGKLLLGHTLRPKATIEEQRTVLSLHQWVKSLQRKHRR